jgi:hypothetical protein
MEDTTKEFTSKRYNSVMSIGFTVHHSSKRRATKPEQIYGLMKRVVDILLNDDIKEATGDLLEDTNDSKEQYGVK